MPAKSRAQQRLMGMEYSRMKEGRGMMGMSLEDVRDYAGTKLGGLPARVAVKKSRGGKKRGVKTK
jgi:hypothetical protein